MRTPQVKLLGAAGAVLFLQVGLAAPADTGHAIAGDPLAPAGSVRLAQGVAPGRPQPFQRDAPAQDSAPPPGGIRRAPAQMRPPISDEEVLRAQNVKLREQVGKLTEQVRQLTVEGEATREGWLQQRHKLEMAIKKLEDRVMACESRSAPK